MKKETGDWVGAPPRLTVVYIITDGNLGGAQMHLRDLISCLPEYITAHVIMGEPRWLGAELKKRQVTVHYVSTLAPPISLGKDGQALICLTKIIRAVGPDLIHCHSSKAGFLGRLAGKWCGVPVVFTAHGWAFSEGVSPKKRFFYRFLERIAALWAQKIICVSEYDRRLGSVALPESKAKLVTIHNGVRDLARGEDLAPSSPEPLRLVMVARFSQPKDQQGLLETLAALKQQGMRFASTFVGEGPRLREAVELATALGLREDVQFLGAREDVAEILAHQDFFVLLSQWEGLPLSVLEAMRQGLPVVASDVGGVGEAVVEGETGYLIPRGDLGCLAQRLRELHDNPSLRRGMGSAGRKRFAELFVLAAMGEKTLAVYHEVLGITR